MRPTLLTLLSLGSLSAGLVTGAAAYQLDTSACEEREYPLLSLNSGESGTTILKFRIGLDGKPIDISISSSSGFPKLDRAARRNLETCKLPVPADAKDKLEVAYKWAPDSPSMSAKGQQMLNDNAKNWRR
jgi:TonB family protein